MEAVTISKNNISPLFTEMRNKLDNVSKEQFKYIYIIPGSEEARQKLIGMGGEVYNNFGDIRIRNNL